MLIFVVLSADVGIELFKLTLSYDNNNNSYYLLEVVVIVYTINMNIVVLIACKGLHH